MAVGPAGDAQGPPIHAVVGAAADRLETACAPLRVGAPFQSVSSHVRRPKRARIHGMRSGGPKRGLVAPADGAIRKGGIKKVTPGEHSPVRASRRLLPFVHRGKSEGGALAPGP